MASFDEKTSLEKETSLAPSSTISSKPDLKHTSTDPEKPDIFVDAVDTLVPDDARDSRRPEKSLSDEKTHYLAPHIIAGHNRASIETQAYRFSVDSEFGPDPHPSSSGTPGDRENEPPGSRGTGIASVAAASTVNSLGLPALTRKETKLAQKAAHPWQHLGITLGLPMILLFDVVVPCIIYYTWYDSHRRDWVRDCHAAGFPAEEGTCPTPKPEFDKDILGYAIVSFGFGELWILVARVWRLYFRREECAPLLSRARWELDATSWVYAVALILGLIPFVVGSSLVQPKLYLYAPSFIMVFLGSLMAITTLCPFKIPIGINSHARGSGLRPFIYYAAEDFIAVDGLQDREFRIRYNERYESNRMFRRFFFNLTLWWMLGVCVYVGCVSAVIWTTEFHIAFGLSLGVLFSYITIWAAVTFIWVGYEMKREHEAYMKDEIVP